jgi:hypothetical protein
MISVWDVCGLVGMLAVLVGLVAALRSRTGRGLDLSVLTILAGWVLLAVAAIGQP